MTATPPELSIVIVSFETRDLLRRCLRSIGGNSPGVPFEIVVIDNNSSDGSADMVAGEFPTVRLIRSGTNGGDRCGGEPSRSVNQRKDSLAAEPGYRGVARRALDPGCLCGQEAARRCHWPKTDSWATGRRKHPPAGSYRYR